MRNVVDVFCTVSFRSDLRRTLVRSIEELLGITGKHARSTSSSHSCFPFRRFVQVAVREIKSLYGPVGWLLFKDFTVVGYKRSARLPQRVGDPRVPSSQAF